jgi:hypothetical protein
MRRPIIIDQDALDAAEQEGVDRRALLTEWLDAKPWAANHRRPNLTRMRSLKPAAPA